MLIGRTISTFSPGISNNKYSGATSAGCQLLRMCPSMQHRETLKHESQHRQERQILNERRIEHQAEHHEQRRARAKHIARA